MEQECKRHVVCTCRLEKKIERLEKELFELRIALNLKAFEEARALLAELVRRKEK